MDYSLISESLMPRVGFKQPFNPSYPPLHPDLISGLGISGISEKYLSPETISDCLVFFDGMDIPDWSDQDTYAKGDKVKFDINGFKHVFVSLQDVNLNKPYTDSNYWESGVSNLLRSYRETAAKEVVKDAISLHNITSYTSRLIKASPVFSENTNGEFIRPKGRFIGTRIKIAERQNLRMDINKVGIKSDTAQTITFYLFHSSQPEALQAFDVEITETNRHVWKELKDANGDGLSINYMNESVSAGGYYILGYFENDSKIYGHDFDDYWACVDCARYNPNFQLWDAYRSYYKVTPIKFESGELNGVGLPDLPDYQNELSRSEHIHFNLNITVSCDPTNLIIQAIEMFDVAFQQKLALMILKDMMFSDRINNIADNARGNVHYIIYGEKSENNYVKGLEGKYKDSIKQIGIDFSDMDVACFSNNKSLYDGPI